jgi:UDPglucose--hexose-1-phosphate uridylyltransferase
MYALELTKPDGRHITLFSRRPIVTTGPAPTPRAQAVQANPHLRWHPLRGEWIAYAAYRQDRTFLPPPEYNPLRPSNDAANPTELPCGDYDIAVFDNLFPTLSMDAHDPPQLDIDTRPGLGHCEVVVFTQDAHTSLGSLPVDHIALLFEVWGVRTAKLAASGAVRYVLPFENRGVEVGVTLHHPHGQMYAYPFVPPIPARMQQRQQEYYNAHARVLLQDLVASELKQGTRVLYEGEHAMAFVPPWARYPYEVWVAPRVARAYFTDLGVDERLDLARALKTVLLKFDGMWQRPFPYIMAWYQAPTDGRAHPEAHLHAEFYPPHRTREKLKYLAGTEIAAGMFASDALPEDKARELQAVVVSV